MIFNFTTVAISIFFIMTVGCKGVRCQDSTFAKDDSLNHVTNQADSVRMSKQLQRFRKLFEKVVAQQKSKQKKVKEDPTLDLGVFIMNQTRTPMGQQFYRSFYQKWKAPKDAGNAMITISEQPSPGLGSVITIKLGYEKVFQARLKPKRRYIVALSKLAIKQCRRIIQRKANVRKRLAGY